MAMTWTKVIISTHIQRQLVVIRRTAFQILAWEPVLILGLTSEVGLVAALTMMMAALTIIATVAALTIIATVAALTIIATVAALTIALTIIATVAALTIALTIIATVAALRNDYQIVDCKLIIVRATYPLLIILGRLSCYSHMHG